MKQNFVALDCIELSRNLSFNAPLNEKKLSANGDKKLQKTYLRKETQNVIRNIFHSKTQR